jgi:ABC-2 type transport system permease protein
MTFSAAGRLRQWEDRTTMAIATSPTSAPGASGEPRPAPSLLKRLRPPDLLFNLTGKEVKAQFKRTTLGRLWSFINPIATLLIYTLVFGSLLKVAPPVGAHGVKNFTLYLAAALIPWTFFSSAIMNGMGAVVANSGLLTKVYFPRWTLVVSAIMALGNTFLIEFSVVMVVMAVFIGPEVFLFIPLLFILIAITMAFSTGLALMLSVALVYFRDTQHFMALFMQIWFYTVPIIYPVSYIPARYLRLYTLNPAEVIVSAYRTMIYDFKVPTWDVWALAIGWAAISLFIGIKVFGKFSARIVEEL